VLTESGNPWRSTIAMIFMPFPRFVAPISDYLIGGAIGHGADGVMTEASANLSLNFSSSQHIALAKVSNGRASRER
jgi:hypothetical protein